MRYQGDQRTARKPATRSPALQRSRHTARADAAAAVLKLVLERGFDTVTTSDMAAAAGLSHRTFFRVFPTKEDALFAAMDIIAERVADSVRQRPPGDPAWDALRDGFIQALEATPDLVRTREPLKFVHDSPRLWAGRMLMQSRWRSYLSQALIERLDVAARPFVADLLAALAVAAFDAAVVEWLRTSRLALRTVVADAMNRARPEAVGRDVL